MKICYTPRRFQPQVLAIIDQADTIVRDYARRGYNLTLRQLFYKFISGDLFPESWIDPVYNKKKKLPPNTKNTEKNYKRLGKTLGNARLAGLISWESIVDRTRKIQRNTHWGSPKEILDGARDSYQIDMWANQPNRVEVWVEKEALLEVISRPCKELDVTYFACKGFSSLSASWRAAQRCGEFGENGQEFFIIYLGDHDPSGVDMGRDIRNKFRTFQEDLTLIRAALTMEQIAELNPPPNPTKYTDPRSRAYVKVYGDESWELDALDPEYIDNLIREEVLKLRDLSLFDQRTEILEEHQTILEDAIAMAEARLEEGEEEEE